MADVQLVTTTRISKTSLTLGRGSPSNEPPAFTLPPRNARVSLGGTARLDGKVRGHPEPQVIWHRNGKAVIGGERHIMEQSVRGTFSLVVQGVQEEDGGRYTCEAVNDAGSRQVTVEIIVEGNSGKKYGLPSSSRAGARFGAPAVESRPSIWGESPPKFITKPSRVFTQVGQSGKFSAKITGRPQPQVTWLKGDVGLQSSGRYSMVERSGMHFLEIREVCVEDAGTYTCSVSNSAGTASASAELNVQGLNREPATTSLPASVVPSPKTTDSPEVRRTSNGLLPEPRPSSRTTDRSESRERQPPLAKDTQERPTPWRTSLSPKPAAELPEGAERNPGPSSPKAVRSTPSPQCARNELDPPRRSTMRPPSEGTPSGETNRESRRQGRESRAERAAVTGAPPRFDSAPQNQEAAEGSKVTFTCQVSGSPAPSVAWLREGQPMRPRPGLSVQQQGHTHSLSLEGLSRRDTGTYGCTLTSPTGQVSSSWTLTVKSVRVEGRTPVFSGVLTGSSVTEGEDLQLHCSVEGRPAPHISWLFNDQPIPNARSSFDNGLAKLMIHDALQEDEGLYTCVAENSHGRAVCSARVLVKAKKSSRKGDSGGALDAKKSLAPVFLRGLKDLKVMDGSQVTMTVGVTGNPPPEVLWLHNGKEIQESEDFHFDRNGNQYSLLIQEVFPEDNGKYTCEVWNQYGEIRTEASLTVQEPQDGVQPWFITKPKSTAACVGQNVLLSCAIAGDPFPEFQWKRGAQILSSGQDYEVLQKEDVVSLLIRQVTAQHAGDYLISLRNKVGDCSCVAGLVVNEGPGVSSKEEGPYVLLSPGSAQPS